MDGVSIGLAGSPLRFLGRDTADLEPTQEVTPVEVDAPFAADDFGNAAAGPEVGGEPERLRTLAEPAEHLTLSGGREFAGPGWRRLGFHAVDAVIPFGRPPELDGPFGDAEELGNVRNGMSVVKMGEGESPSPFEFGRRAVWSHDP